MRNKPNRNTSVLPSSTQRVYKQGEGTLWVTEIKTAKVSPLYEGGDVEMPGATATVGTAFKAERAAGYFTNGIANNGWSKSPIGSYNGWGGSVPIDTVSGFDQTNSRWVCPEGEAGIYMVGFWLQTNDNGASVSNEKWRPYINGGATGFEDDVRLSNDGVGHAGAMQMIQLSEGDYVEWWFFAYWNSELRLTGCAQWGFKV
jgi:hypothetical protein